jgi:Sap, sulfolipid-1-addressing protein
VDPVTLVLLALAASVYPTLLAGVILILARPRPLRMLFGFLAGGLTISVIAGIAIVRGLESSGAVSTSHHTTKPIISIVAGAVSLAVAWGIWSGAINRGLSKHTRRKRDPDAPKKPSMASRALSRGSITMAFAAGLVLNLPGVWYLDALTEIAKAMPSNASALLQLLVFNVIMFFRARRAPDRRLRGEPEGGGRPRPARLAVGPRPLSGGRDRPRHDRRGVAHREGNRPAMSTA